MGYTESLLARLDYSKCLLVLDVRCIEYVPSAAGMGTVQDFRRVLFGSHCW